LIFLYSSLHGLEFVRRKDPRRAWLFLSVTIYAILVNFIDTAWLGLNQLWMLQLVVVAETVRYSRSSNSGSTLYQPAEVLTLGGIPKSEDR
jgi:hypothetical protein